VYATTRKFSTSDPGPVFRSADGGVTWEDTSAGITNLSAHAIAIDPTASDRVFTGTDAGVFMTVPQPPAPRQFTLSVTRAGIGRGTITSTPSGIDCGNDCGETYVEGSTITLRATPSLGSVFWGWNGCDAATGNTCTVEVTRERSVTAHFLGVPLKIPLR
jgi:hypothetical protein